MAIIFQKLAYNNQEYIIERVSYSEYISPESNVTFDHSHVMHVHVHW